MARRQLISEAGIRYRDGNNLLNFEVAGLRSKASASPAARPAPARAQPACVRLVVRDRHGGGRHRHGRLPEFVLPQAAARRDEQPTRWRRELDRAMRKAVDRPAIQRDFAISVGKEGGRQRDVEQSKENGVEMKRSGPIGIDRANAGGQRLIWSTFEGVSGRLLVRTHRVRAALLRPR